MYRGIGVESDGELYKMQQDAIRRAKETASQSSFKSTPHEETNAIQAKTEIIEAPTKRGLFSGGGGLSKLFGGFKSDDLLLLAVLFLLVNENADEDIILIVAFLLFSGMK